MCYNFLVMSLLLNPPLTTRELVRMASDELDSRQLAVIARLSPTECLALMFEMCDFMRQLASNVERHYHPNLTEDEIDARISRRILTTND